MDKNKRRTLRTAALTIALAIVGLLMPPLGTSAATMTTTTDATQGAAAFLARQLGASENHFRTQWGTTPEESSDDVGLTIDGILALSAAGVAQEQSTKSTDWVMQNLASYIGTGAEKYAGATAKAAYVMQVQGRDPRSVNGTDLIATLSTLQNDSGRIVDQSAWGDYANTFGQAWTVLALKRANAPFDKARDFLLSQQCNDGGFRSALGDANAPCFSAIDSTALSLHALLATDASTVAAVEKGLQFLVDRQSVNGGFSTATGEPENSNSTGLAASALASGGKKAAYQKAGSFLTRVQLPCDAASSIAGAIAYEPSSFADHVAKGTAATPQDKDRRATTQAVLGLAGTSLGSLSSDGASMGVPAFLCQGASTTTVVPTEKSTTTLAPSITSLPPTSASVTQAQATVEPIAHGPQLAKSGTQLLATLRIGILLGALGIAVLTLVRLRRARA